MQNINNNDIEIEQPNTNNKIQQFSQDEDLETNGGIGKKRISGRKLKLIMILISLVIVAIVVLLVVFLLPRGVNEGDTEIVNSSGEKKNKLLAGKKNIIVMIGDGMGPSAISLARETNKQRLRNLKDYNGLLPVTHLHLDPYLVGTVQTYSYDSIITDSAAAATTYASGVKTINHAVGVDHNKKPVATVMEAAKLSGMKTGLVVTTRISDATPACFFSHSVLRTDEAFIITQLLDKQVDIVLGGGKSFFTSQILSDAESVYNYTMVSNTSDMNKVESGKMMGLFSSANLPWEIDRLNNDTLKSTIPSLQEMTIKALELINQDNENGFLLMVEGSKIDVAAHINDAPTQVWETLAFDETFEIVRKFAEVNGDTIVIVTADHETGGLALGNQPVIDGNPLYTWSTDKLLAIKKSADSIADLIKKGAEINSTLSQYGNIKSLTDDQWLQLNSSISKYYLNQFIGKIISASADIGFTTGGHTGEDVNLYTYGDHISIEKYEKRLQDNTETTIDNFSDPILMGNINNIDIASFILKTLNLENSFKIAQDKLSDFIPSPPLKI